MPSNPRFPRHVFQVAGIYGLAVLLPQYFVELGFGPPANRPILRPEHFYGFLGVAVAWQLVFLLIAKDVRRYRPLMLLGLVEKLSFGLAVIPLFALSRIRADVLAAGMIDLALGTLFFLSYRATPAQD